jgi:hypothetical protein
MNLKMLDNLIEIEIFINQMGCDKEISNYYTLQGKITSTLKRLEKTINIDNNKYFTFEKKLEHAVNEIRKRKYNL